MSDVITVPSHTKKDNPKAASNPIHAVNDADPPLRRHPARPGTPAGEDPVPAGQVLDPLAGLAG